MLTDAQVDDIWKRMVKAEVRSLYYADLASSYAREKRFITFVTFFSSSAAVATIVAKLHPAIPGCLSVIGALLAAYSIAMGLDKRAETLMKLHHQWNALYAEYFRLWNHWNEGEAEKTLEALIVKAMEASDLGTVEDPKDGKRLEAWTKKVFAQYNEEAAA